MVSAAASLRSVTFGPGRSNPTSGLSSLQARPPSPDPRPRPPRPRSSWPATRRHASVPAVRCNASAFSCGSSPSIARSTSRATSTCGRRCSPRSARDGLAELLAVHRGGRPGRRIPRDRRFRRVRPSDGRDGRQRSLAGGDDAVLRARRSPRPTRASPCSTSTSTSTEGLPPRREERRQVPAETLSSGIRLASAIASAAGFASFRRFGRGMPASIQRSISWNSSSISTSDETFFSTRPCA